MLVLNVVWAAATDPEQTLNPVEFRVELLIIKVAKSFAIAVVAYAFAWLGTYIVVMGGDMKYLGDYFILSWTGGLELVAFIQLIAVCIGLLTWAVAYYKMKRLTS